MVAKVLSQVAIYLLGLIPGLISKAMKSYQDRRKRNEERKAAEDAARKVEGANSPDDARAHADDVP